MPRAFGKRIDLTKTTHKDIRVFAIMARSPFALVANPCCIWRQGGHTLQSAREWGQQRRISMILGCRSALLITILHVIISTLVAIGSGLIVVGGMFSSDRLPVTTRAVPFHHGSH